MAKGITLGYIFVSKELSIEDKLFIKTAKKKNIKLVLFNLTEKLSEEEIETKAKKCKIVFNNTAGYLAIELAKTIEELGIKVIDSSDTFYYTEDKWMFFLKCQAHNIPTPKTILLSANLTSAREELKDFNQWPVILKRVNGEQGEFVQKANDLKEALKLIKNFWDKGIERLPIIAQEFIHSPSYRVTLIGNKIVQAAAKKSHGWKSTAVYAEKVDHFKPDKELENLATKITKVCKIHICGLDFMRRGNDWLVIDINAEPSFEFFEEEHEEIVSKVLDFLKEEAQKIKE